MLLNWLLDHPAMTAKYMLLFSRWLARKVGLDIQWVVAAHFIACDRITACLTHGELILVLFLPSGIFGPIC